MVGQRKYDTKNTMTSKDGEISETDRTLETDNAGLGLVQHLTDY